MTEAGSAASPPVFVVGVHRSGTTLLGLMLRGHPQLAFLGEFEYAVDFYRDGWPDAEALRAQLETDRRFRAQAFEVAPTLEGRALMDSFLDQTRARQGGKPRVGATFHRHFDRVVALWPEARIVHLLRDGRDVAMSRIGMGWAGNVWTSCAAWRRMESLWERVAPGIAAERLHELRYEDLVRAPEETLRRLCDFLALDWEPQALLSYPERSGYGPPDPTLAAQWRRRLSPRELAWLEYEIGPLLAARGYPPSGVAPRRPNALERAWLRVQDRVARARFRLRRFGLGLVVADFLSRRLGARSVQRRIQRRMDEITTAHLR